MDKQSFEFLKNLLDTPSPSGFEEKASEIWREYIENAYAENDNSGGMKFSIETDVYGNSIATINPPNESANKILLCGHIDEVGMMINYINDKGFLYVSSIGGVDAAILPAQRVIIHNKNGPVNGVIGRCPPHLRDKDEDDKVKFHNVFVDIGATNKNDALKLVSIGDPITFDAPHLELANGRLAGRGLDDRVGAWVVAQVLERLIKRGNLQVPVVGAATIQEENGMFGGRMVAEKVKPTVALAIDVTHAIDVPGLSSEKYGDCKIGNGPVLSVGSVSHKKVNCLLEKAGCGVMPIQKQSAPRRTGTDADAIFISNGGVATGVVSIPNRYMHSPVEVVQLTDLDWAVKLITEWCELIEPDTSWK